MKNKRFKTAYAANASKLHKKVGEILRANNPFFGLAKIYQEYPVYRIQPNYSNKSHRFDWVLLDHKLVIECHGEQHYHLTGFGGDIDPYSMQQQKLRDLQKAKAAESAGFTYIVVPYWDYDKVDAEYLYRLYKQCYNDLEIQVKPTKEASEYDRNLKERAHEYRKARYQKLKALKKARESHEPKLR